MMARKAGTAACVAAVIMLSGCGSDEPRSEASPHSVPAYGHAATGDLVVSDAWIAQPLPSAGEQPMMVAGYAGIENTGTTADRLVRASSPVASTVEIHRTVDMKGAAGTMRPVDDLTLPPEATTALEPGGYHLMFIGLKHPLRVGADVEVRLGSRAEQTCR